MGTTLLDNIFAHLGESNRFFAFKLGREGNFSDPNATNSSFTIGELDPSIVGGPAEITYFPVFKTQASPYDYWKLPIRNLTIDGHPLPLSTSLVPGAPSPIAVLDTGTTLILGPTPDVNAFWDSIGTGGSTRYNAQTGLWEVRCDRAVDVRFAFGQGNEGKEYAVHPEDVSWAEGGRGNGWCMGGVQINDGVRERMHCSISNSSRVVSQVNSGDWLLGDVFLRVSQAVLWPAARADDVLRRFVQNVYVVHQGVTSSKPALIGLMSLTDPQTAFKDFQDHRGTDLAPAPLVATRTPLEQWTQNARIASSVSAVGGFLLGGLIVVSFKFGRKPKIVAGRR